MSKDATPFDLMLLYYWCIVGIMNNYSVTSREGYKLRLLSKWVGGFTFLQMLITLSIVFILLLIGIPNLMNLIQDNRLKSAVELFYVNTQFARAEAVRGSDDIYVDINPGSLWCYGVNRGSSCNCQVASSCLIGGTAKVVTYNDFPSVVLSIAGFSGTLQFEHMRGILAGNGGTITFGLGSKNIQVQINSLGRMRICSATVGGYKPC